LLHSGLQIAWPYRSPLKQSSQLCDILAIQTVMDSPTAGLRCIINEVGRVHVISLWPLEQPREESESSMFHVNCATPTAMPPDFTGVATTRTLNNFP
ncbi:MAG TPA: hypothetical protein VJR48_08700, partial [Ktedonobacterales bacterium]|nr:hypothetical protein [Ktedonobacterales bacterium]